ncbi:MAG: hypothetical protein GW941_01840 [Candidatus Pacebacteria bacterium]|nr:hypothetical protein [Candidatus Paceibacterota bacterium]
MAVTIILDGRNRGTADRVSFGRGQTHLEINTGTVIIGKSKEGMPIECQGGSLKIENLSGWDASHQCDIIHHIE